MGKVTPRWGGGMGGVLQRVTLGRTRLNGEFFKRPRLGEKESLPAASG